MGSQKKKKKERKKEEEERLRVTKTAKTADEKPYDRPAPKVEQ